jgi:hypothetical protein
MFNRGKAMNYGSIITRETYHDSTVISTKVEYEQSIFSERESLFKDIIEAMAILTNGSTKKVTLEIKIDDKERIRILKRWSV